MHVPYLMRPRAFVPHQELQRPAKRRYVPAPAPDVLDEDTFQEALGHVITRDFFPVLHNAKEAERALAVQAGVAPPPPPHPAAALGLKEFLHKFTSEDNASFGELQERQRKELEEKFAWLHKNEVRVAGACAGACPGPDHAVRSPLCSQPLMIEYPEPDRPGAPSLWRYTVRNALMYT
jgi:hypothetical protein